MIDKNEIPKEETHDKKTQNKTSLVLTYNRFLPKLATLFESTGVYLILADYFKGYFKRN